MSDTIIPSGFAPGQNVNIVPTPDTFNQNATIWAVVRDVIGGVLLEGIDVTGISVQIVVPAYFLEPM